jgi:hypothetical protein
MGRNTEFTDATRRYKPKAVRVLFIAEAPPALRFHRFFYFEHLRDGDTLFLEMMKVLYPDIVGFKEGRLLPASPAPQMRRRKPELLERFMQDGYLLLDASEEPMPDRASSSQKLAILQGSVPRLIARLREFEIDRDTPVLLIGGVTFAACSKPLANLGFNVINRKMIDHPARGGQVRFRQKLEKALQGIQRSTHNREFNQEASASIEL